MQYSGSTPSRSARSVDEPLRLRVAVAVVALVVRDQGRVLPDGTPSRRQ